MKRNVNVIIIIKHSWSTM